MQIKITVVLVSTLFLFTGCAITNYHANENIPAAESNLELGLAYLKRGNLANAKSKLLKALNMAPDYSVANDAYAYFLETTGEIKLAQVYYLRGIQLATLENRGAALNNYGAYLFRRGHFKEAEQYFLSAAKDKNYLDVSLAYKNAGVAAISMHNQKLANSYFIKSKAGLD